MHTLIKDYLREVKATRSAKTFSDYSEALERFSPFCEGAKKFTRSMVVDFILKMKEDGYANSYMAGHETVVRSFYSWLVPDHLPVNPLLGKRICVYRSKQRPDDFGLTDDDYTKIKAHCIEKGKKQWLGAVIVGWNTGLRLGDVAQLKWSSVDLDKKCLRVKPQKTVRFAKELEIPLLPELYVYLVEHKEGRSEYLFPKLRRLYQESGHLPQSFTYMLRRCGIQGKSFHSLRHGFISRAIGRGVPVGVVSSLTGQTLPVLQRYMHVSFADKTKQMMEAMA